MTTSQFINPFEEVVLHHPQTHLFAHVIPLGLNVTRLVFKESDKEHDLIIGPESSEDHWKLGRKFLGPIIGRYANRLPAGKHHFDNETRTINIAEFSAKNVALHGGPEEEDLNLPQLRKDSDRLIMQKGPFDRLIWQRISIDQSQFFSKEESSSFPSESWAIFGLLNKGVSIDGEQKGYPGDIRIEVRLAVIPGNGQMKTNNIPRLGNCAGKLQMEYRVSISDNECMATPLNITHHWAFNLSASEPKARARDGGKIDNHTLLLFPLEEEENEKKSSKLYTLSLDDQMVPDGSLIDCSGTQHDWSDKGKEGFGRTIIHKGSLNGYDHFYCWGSPSTQQQNDQARLLLHSPATELSLAFYTNQSGVQVYTTNGQPCAPANAMESGGAMKRIHADDGDEIYGNAQRSGVALEFGHPHATFLHKSYQDLAKNDTILRKGEQYHHWLEVEVYKKVQSN